MLRRPAAYYNPPATQVYGPQPQTYFWVSFVVVPVPRYSYPPNTSPDYWSNAAALSQQEHQDTTFYGFSSQFDYIPNEETLILDELEPMLDTGFRLNEEFVSQRLKTRKHVKPRKVKGEEPEICVICQDEYKNNERIGILTCSHEYHVDCIKNWVLRKNVCPLCNGTALATEGNGRVGCCTGTALATEWRGRVG